MDDEEEFYTQVMNMNLLFKEMYREPFENIHMKLGPDSGQTKFKSIWLLFRLQKNFLDG